MPPATGARTPGTCASTAASDSAAGSRNSPAPRSPPGTGAAAPAPLRIARRRPGGRARGGQRHQPQRRCGDDPQRPFRADQQLRQVVAAIVLLQRRKAIMHAAVRQHRLDAATSPRIDRSAAPACRPHWSRRGHRRSHCPSPPASAESAAPAQAPHRAGRTGSPPPPRRRAPPPHRRCVSVHPRSDRISADPSAGGVAPPTIELLPPCGTSATRCRAAAATTAATSAVEAGASSAGAVPRNRCRQSIVHGAISADRSRYPSTPASGRDRRAVRIGGSHARPLPRTPRRSTIAAPARLRRRCGSHPPFNDRR